MGNLRPTPQLLCKLKGLFHRKSGGVFSLLSMPRVLWPTKNYLSNCYSLLELWNEGPLCHQTETIKSYLLCGLFMSVHFSKRAGECWGQSILASFTKTVRKCLVYVHVFTLGWVPKNLTTTHAYKPQPRDDRALQMPMVSCLNKCHDSTPPLIPTRWWESTTSDLAACTSRFCGGCNNSICHSSIFREHLNYPSPLQLMPPVQQMNVSHIV